MANYKQGDRVRILTREATEEDARVGTYYAHYGGLTGTVQKVYSKEEVAVEVEPESLTKEIRRRHDDVRQQMKTKWLDGLSEEGRNRLTEREKDFNLRYVVLVAMKDLEKLGAKPRPPAVEAESARVPPPADAARSAAPAHQETRNTRAAAAAPAPEEPRRRTLAEIEADEAAELARRAARQTKKE